MSLAIIFSNLRILASPVALAPGGLEALTQPRSPRIYRKIVAGTFGLLMVLIGPVSVRAAEPSPITLTVDAREIDKQRIEARLVIPANERHLAGSGSQTLPGGRYGIRWTRNYAVSDEPHEDDPPDPATSLADLCVECRAALPAAENPFPGSAILWRCSPFIVKFPGARRFWKSSWPTP